MARARKTVLGGREAVKVAIAQLAPVFMDREASIEKACKIIADAAAGGAELIVFPEVWLAGYPYWTEGWDSPVGDWVGQVHADGEIWSAAIWNAYLGAGGGTCNSFAAGPKRAQPARR